MPERTLTAIMFLHQHNLLTMMRHNKMFKMMMNELFSHIYKNWEDDASFLSVSFPDTRSPRHCTPPARQLSMRMCAAHVNPEDDVQYLGYCSSPAKQLSLHTCTARVSRRTVCSIRDNAHCPQDSCPCVRVQRV
jgi:hypothetical protein